ncbi:MAG TPA: HD-GYP domain-containing protein [Gemmatimonadales bacterium]|nr:HD-GYP domain-containing protein [Gemmatimonadales bacterium]
MRCVASWNSQLMQGDAWAGAGRRQWFALNDGPIHADAGARRERDAGRLRPSLDARGLAVVRGFRLSIESSDGYTYGHSERVARYASQVAGALGMAEVEIDAVRVGAYLHDVGKIRVPYEILNKAGRLTPAEFDVMKMHAVWGLELLEGVEFPFDVRSIIRWHHEKRDGSGYPDGLKGDEIPLCASIIGIVDVYDALTSARSYRPAMSPADALREMGSRRSWWRPEVYDAFLSAEALPTFRPTVRAMARGGVAGRVRTGSPAAA